MNGVPDVMIRGQGLGFQLGWSAGSAGDVNNDSYDDVIIGVPGFDGIRSNEGMAHILYGGESMDDIPDIELVGEGENDRFGTSVSTAFDILHDGFDDIIIGAPFNTNNALYAGKTYLFAGF